MNVRNCVLVLGSICLLAHIACIVARVGSHSSWLELTVLDKRQEQGSDNSVDSVHLMALMHLKKRPIIRLDARGWWDWSTSRQQWGYASPSGEWKRVHYFGLERGCHKKKRKYSYDDERYLFAEQDLRIEDASEVVWEINDWYCLPKSSPKSSPRLVLPPKAAPPVLPTKAAPAMLQCLSMMK